MVDNRWWMEFFDRAYTDLWTEAGAFDATAEDVEGILSLLGHPDAGLRILDVPCGFGRHSAELHRHGHVVTGVDLSEVQLAIAAARNPGPTYVHGDMRTPPAGPFDAVLNLFSSIGYFADPAEDERAIKAWHDVLAPGGRLVLETNHRDRMATVHRPGETLRIGDTGAVEFGDMNWVTGRMRRTVRSPDGAERHFDVRMYTATELVDMVRRAGFASVEVHGGLDRRAFSPDSRLVVLATRR